MFGGSFPPLPRGGGGGGPRGSAVEGAAPSDAIGARSFAAMNKPVLPNRDRTRNLANWAVLAGLGAVAALLYVLVMVKIAKFGF